ncbi:copper resistance protein CopC [Aeromicrobium fastidiosum]|uniref:copper resistance CopC family protein n=1 Tax=Aeromicrobium fastidiosum TaxID=52699 RepID=UPI002023556E|nr:copper resistance protein CopC [Aeromicrobium fastidiosum]MCL8250523.1 copper resistance protein CopC [Aeromicrobium fastidiosum]
MLLVALLSALPTAGAWAHSALISSNPSTGTTISTLPGELELKFNDQLSDIAPALIVRRADKTVAVLQPRIDGTFMRADAPAEQLPDGSYQLVWRIVSGDGHPVNGVIPFRIGGDQEPATAAPTKAQAPPQSSTSTTTAIGLGIVPVVLLAVLLMWRLTHQDTKEEHE